MAYYYDDCHHTNTAGCIRVWVFFSGIFLARIPGVLCDNYDIGALCTSAAMSILLLAVVIGMLVGGLSWSNWYPKYMWGKGKVKMPRAYWKKRKEAKLRLLYGSRSGLGSVAAAAPSETGLPNGHSRARDTASWIQGWNNAHPMDDKGYEEMALAMDLDEEDKEEVRIVTTVVDNETLDLGPFKDTTNNTTTVPISRASASSTSVPAASPSVSAGVRVTQNPAARTSYSGAAAQQPPLVADAGGDDPYVYSTVDRSSRKSTKTTAATVQERAPPAIHVTSTRGGVSVITTAEEKVTSFSKDPYLVAL